MPAGRFDLLVEQGATFHREVLWHDIDERPVDLTGYTAQMQVRASVKSRDVMLELSTANGLIVLYPALGKLVLYIPATATNALPSKRAVYDLELTSPSGVVTRLLEGSFHISPQVTR